VDPPRNWQLGTVTVILLILPRPGHWQTALSESGAMSFDTCATASDWWSAYPTCPGQWRAAQSSGSPPGEAASDSEARRPNLKISSEGVLTSYDAHGLGVSEL
jgi:hypothetical protein